MSAVVVVFWVSLVLLLYTQAGYAVLLLALSRLRRRSPPGAQDSRSAAATLTQAPLPSVSIVVAAYAEEAVIASRVANLRELDYPAELVEVIVACDGSPDATAARAREAGADLVLDLPRGGKVSAQNAAVERARGEILAFSDANARWEPTALRELVRAFEDPRVGYACGEVRLTGAGTNQEGLYWRYEMMLRGLESALRSITGGNGAIYATRRGTYLRSEEIIGHDLAFPFNMVKRGWRAVYVPQARSTEKMAPSIESEFTRKRRMASQSWRTTVRCGMLSPRGYDPLYALMIFSHRILRYASPFLHVLVLATSLALLHEGWFYDAALAAQLALLVAAAIAPLLPLRIMLVARYYVMTTTSLLAGLWDWIRHGAPVGWEPIEGTR